MKKYLSNYINDIDNLIKKKNITNKDINEHLIKIKFFQHERLIHLLVTLFYAFLFLVTLVIGTYIWAFIIVSLILMCFLIPYILYYFFMENNVQYLYKQYDQMLKINNKRNK